MSFAYAVSGQTIFGNLRVKWGTATNGAADTGGAIETGLAAVFMFSAIPTSHTGASPPKYSVSGGVVTIVSDTGTDFNWMAIGK